PAAGGSRGHLLESGPELEQPSADVALDGAERQTESVGDVLMPTVVHNRHPDDGGPGLTERGERMCERDLLDGAGRVECGRPGGHGRGRDLGLRGAGPGRGEVGTSATGDGGEPARKRAGALPERVPAAPGGHEDLLG